MNKLYVVGDSTLAEFNDITYLFPRYGYATKLNEYFNIEVVNLARSGRSSLSFLKEENYQKLLDNLSEGDFLLIGFGHNDEKEDDPSRFTSAKLPLEDKKSFINSIYYNYVDLAIKRNATPIISTPVSRITRGEYAGDVIHDTRNGNYKDALIKLGKDKNITVINLTDNTKRIYEELGFDEAKYHHAVSKAVDKVDGKYIIKDNAIDKTHLSSYGAKVVAYLFAEEIKNSDSKLKEFLKKDLVEPTIKDIEYNPEYKLIKYTAPDLKSYKSRDNFNSYNGLYGTMLGSVNSYDGLGAYHTDKYYLTDYNHYGRVMFSTTAGSYLFKQIKKEDNFICKAKLKVLDYSLTNNSALGLMIRDDSYIDFNKDNVVVSNEILAGVINLHSSLYFNYNRVETTSIERGECVPNTVYEAGDIIECEITRLGQRINTKTKFKDKIVEAEYLDFDLFGIDNDYYYVGIFSSKNEKVVVEDFEFILTNKAMEA